MKEEKVGTNTQLTRSAGNKGGKSTARHRAGEAQDHPREFANMHGLWTAAQVESLVGWGGASTNV